MKVHTKTIEYNIVEHCNLRCAHCDHASPLIPERNISPEAIRRDLQVLSTALHCEELKIIGGEPLLHPQLLEIIEIGRASGIADKLTVATNGLLLHRMSNLFWESINRLWLSIYPGIRLSLSLNEIESLAHRHAVVVDIFDMTHFRQTLLNRRTEDDHLVKAIYSQCKLPTENVCHTLRNGRFYKCSPAPFLVDRLPNEDLQDEAAKDAVDIHETTCLAVDISQYLKSEEPLTACSFCLGSSGPEKPHRQYTRQELSQPFDLTETDSAQIHLPEGIPK